MIATNGPSLADRIVPLLRDPKTGEPLRSEPGRYVSLSGVYPIVNGVPRFVENDRYVASFSFEWTIHATTQLDNVRQNTVMENQFRKKTGFAPEELKGKLILDAGVGAGPYAEIASRWGADVVGVDLSYAVESAHGNLADRPNVWIAQADIGALPFAPGTFDAIFSIGVLHHTPDTRAFFLKLVPLLKPGGTIAIWVYSLERDYVNRARWIPFTNKIPPRMFYAWCRWFVPWALAHYESQWVRAIHRIFPFSRQPYGIENDILDTFDGFSPRYHGIHGAEEVEGWFREAGLVDIHAPSEFTTCMRGRRPE